MPATKKSVNGRRDSSPSQRELFLQRVELRMRQLDLNQSDVAKLIGRDQSTVSDWLNPEIRSLPDGEAMLKLPEALRANGEWLLTGRGAPERTHISAAVVVRDDGLKAEGAMQVIQDVRVVLLEAEKRLTRRGAAR